jgi:glutamate synthase domain-containing protein 1
MPAPLASSTARISLDTLSSSPNNLPEGKQPDSAASAGEDRMCGIVGLLVKKREARADLGRLAAPMFACMAERGPDSGGMAVFGEPVPAPRRRFNLFSVERNADWDEFLKAFRASFPGSAEQMRLEPLANHAVLTCGVEPTAVRAWLAGRQPPVVLLSVGRFMDVYKDEGPPTHIARQYHFAELTGSHCVGHTRMATESSVTPAHAHPFTAGEDFCLVHNGSLSNPYMLRRMLERRGERFETDNDTEAACRFLEWRLAQGDSLEQALEQGFRHLDGFYTLLIGTPDRLTLVRDPFACKPAVVAETDDYVAVATEFRSLAHLPGMAHANIFEPAPERIYSWKASAA